VCGVVDTPVPETLMVAGEFVASLAIETLPLTAPAVAGANCTVTVIDWFGVSISPAVTPLAPNPAPVTLTFEMVTLALPLFVRATLSELLLPTFTLPKLKLVVLRPSTFVDAMPVPLSGMESGEVGALLASVIEPEAAPAVVGANTALNVAFLPARIVSGALMPEILNPAPVTPTDEIVKLADPPFDTVMVCELLVPVETLPKAALDGVAAICACVPVPLRPIARGEFGALLTSEMLPVALPPVVGANCAVKVAVCPALIVNGVVRPLIANPAPEVLACEMVRLAVPEFVRVTVCEPELPTATEPKVTDAGLAPSCACAPVPVIEMVVGEFGALLTIEIVPLAPPPVDGANCAVNEVLWPAPKVFGVASPLMLNPAPVVVAWEIVTLADPLFVNVTVCEPELPVATEPNVTTAGLAPSCPCTPVPDIEIAAGEPCALLVIETLPVALPADVGANVALNEALLPALIVIGMLAPLTPYPGPDAVN
jgi:hypothetical protein